jgi:DNA-binding FadR family transcriptional regulator
MAVNTLHRPVLYMRRQGSTSSSNDRLQQISTELASLFQQQIELTRREALAGLTPAECEEYDKIVEGIRESYSELARIRSGS